MEEPATTISISVSRKVNLGNYESADVFVSLSGLSPDVSDEEITIALTGASRIFDAIRRDVNAKANALRGGR